MYGLLIIHLLFWLHVSSSVQTSFWRCLAAKLEYHNCSSVKDLVMACWVNNPQTQI